MNPLVPLQIVVPVEALWTLIAFERPVIRGLLLMWWMAQDTRKGRRGPAVETVHDVRVHAVD